MWANWVIRWHLSCHRESCYSPRMEVLLLGWTAVFDHGVFPLQTCLRTRWRCDALRVRSQRAGLVICALCFSCKEMRCHENKDLAMLACAACAREKQHLLGQLLKETEINQWENGTAKHWLYTCLVRMMGFRSPIPLTQTDNIPK